MDEKKAKESKSLDQLMELCNKEGIELPDELLDGVAGGVLSPRDQGRRDFWIELMRRTDTPEEEIQKIISDLFPDE